MTFFFTFSTPFPTLSLPHPIMSLLFTDFASWQAHCAATGEPLYQPVLAYEIEQKGATEEAIWPTLQRAYDVMRDAVHEGQTGNMTSRSGMINNGAKKIAASPITVLSPEFKEVVISALGAKEVNSCMAYGRGIRHFAGRAHHYSAHS
jgi:L-serine dehydratase